MASYPSVARLSWRFRDTTDGEYIGVGTQRNRSKHELCAFLQGRRYDAPTVPLHLHGLRSKSSPPVRVGMESHQSFFMRSVDVVCGGHVFKFTKDTLVFCLQAVFFAPVLRSS